MPCSLKAVPDSSLFEGPKGQEVTLVIKDHIGSVLIAKADYGGRSLVPAGETVSRLTFALAPDRNTLKLVLVFPRLRTAGASCARRRVRLAVPARPAGDEPSRPSESWGRSAMRPRILLVLLVLAAASPASAQIEECGFFSGPSTTSLPEGLRRRRTTMPPDCSASSAARAVSPSTLRARSGSCSAISSSASKPRAPTNSRERPRAAPDPRPLYRRTRRESPVRGGRVRRARAVRRRPGGDDTRQPGGNPVGAPASERLPVLR